MELPGRDERGDAAVHVMRDPGERILRRGEIAEGRMGVGVDQAGDGGHPAGIGDDIGTLVEPVAGRPDDAIFDIDGIGIAQRVFQISSD